MGGVRFEVRVNGRFEAVPIHRHRPIDVAGAGSYYARYQGYKPETGKWGKVMQALGRDKDRAFTKYQDIAERLRQGLEPDAPNSVQIPRDLTNPLLKPVSAPGLNDTGTAWKNLYAAFQASTKSYVRAKMLAPATETRYLRSARIFDAYLKARGVVHVPAITRDIIDDFCRYRIDNGAIRAWDADAKALHVLFEFAIEKSMIDLNPVQVKKLRGRMGKASTNSNPFSKDEIAKMQKGIKPEEKLLFYLMLQTGMRKGDAISLCWSEIVNGRIVKMPKKTERKTGAVVRVPIQAALQAELDVERRKRNPAGDDHVLLNPNTKKAYTESRLYEHCMEIGRRVGVPNVNPHRFRGSFAHDCYLRGIKVQAVAAWLGDTVKTVLRHYTFFTEELGEQAEAKLMGGSGGLLQPTAS
jgi:integrase